MTFFVLLLGLAAFGLFCIINPKYLLERMKKKNGKEYNAKDIRFFRIFGAVLVALFLLCFFV